jgi:hypothetical protein
MATKKTTAKKATVKKPVMQYGGAKKKLPKAQIAGQTPFQQYMKNPGATASDTTMRTLYPGSSWDAPKSPVSKNPKNQKALEGAFEKTYGQNWKSESGQPAPGETFEQYKRRMGPMKKGGATKMAKGGTVAKAKEGGDKKWIQKATASIKRRGTEGKCTPITKPGCTGKAKALAKTFKKIAKSNKKK